MQPGSPACPKIPQDLSAALLNCALPLLQVSAGGLVSALMGVGNFQTKWIGWPGALGVVVRVLPCRLYRGSTLQTKWIGWPGGDQQWVGRHCFFRQCVFALISRRRGIGWSGEDQQ